jgi:hypothetical protein
MTSSTDTQTSNRGGIFKVAARLVTTGIISFGIGGAVTFDRYNSYWNQTIFRVQTVDFNILSHTLPTKLSYALIKKQPKEIQRTLDSNYSLFGLIVTDSSGQKIIAYSGKDAGKSSSWKAALNPQELKNHPYDVLLDPPPVFAQWTYSKPQATERSATNFTNQGRVIGRIYYVRGVRPTFQEDLIKWLSNPFSESSRIQTYTTSLAACFGATLLIWSGLEFILYRKRVDRQNAQHDLELAEEREQDLIDNNQILQSQLTQRINELQSLQKQRDDERNELIKDADNLRSSNNRLKQEIAKLSESIKDLPNNTGSELQTELEKTKLQSEQNLAKKKQYEQHIQKLTRQLQIVERKQVETNQVQKQKESEIQELQEQINNTESQLTELQNNEENYQETIKILEKQLNDKNSREIELQKQLENLQSSLSEYRLAEEMERYIEETGQHPLNDFEVAIKECLEHNFSNARIEIQFDVGTGRQGSRFTDFILVTEKYCIIIEAKSYTGKIQPIDNVRNSGWICERGSQRIHIFSCWGKNPYQQIKTYCDSLMKNRGLGINSRLPVYGIVVFPKGSCIDNSIQSNISAFYRVTTLDNFTTDIQELENQAQFN